jgi:hypothetical protein
MTQCQCAKSQKEPTIRCPLQAQEGSKYCGKHKTCKKQVGQVKEAPKQVKQVKQVKQAKQVKQVKQAKEAPKQGKEETIEGAFEFNTDELGKQLNKKVKNVSSVEFEVTRYGELEPYIIKFDSPVTEVDAVIAAEQYLSAVMTREYFKEHSDESFDELVSEFVTSRKPVRGDVLGDLKNIDEIERSGKHIVLVLGS